ncbi:MAG: nitroreductase [Pseudomonadota bacterium]
MNEFERILKTRHSCRAFQPTPLPRETIERMLALAQHTPSWCNTQPWQVHLVSGEPLERFRTQYVERVQTREGRADLDVPLAYRGEYQARRLECGMALYASVGITRQDKAAAKQQGMENYRFFGAPHLAVITTPRDLGAYGAVDCGGYLATLLYAAASLGVAAVPQAAVAMHSDFVREFLGIADTRLVVAGVSFGLAAVEHPINGFRTTRASLDDVVTWVE